MRNIMLVSFVYTPVTIHVFRYTTLSHKGNIWFKKTPTSLVSRLVLLSLVKDNGWCLVKIDSIISKPKPLLTLMLAVSKSMWASLLALQIKI